MKNEARVKEILDFYGEDVGENTWAVQGQRVILHKALERIAAAAGITYDAPHIIRAECEEAVILVTGRMGDKAEWSIGEALVNVNYRVSGRQAAYPFAMAEKRAKDRVILKLIGLHGLLYSEEEGDELKAGRPGAAPAEKHANVVNADAARTEKRKLLHERAREKCRAGREAWLTWREQLTAAQREAVEEIWPELNDILREHAVQRGESA